MAAVPTSRLPFDIQLPHTWSRTGAKAPGEMRFVVNGADGRAAGSVVIAPVASGAAGDSFSASRRKSLGGVSLATLGRTVIDRMIAEGGWVMNDFVRQMEGRRVYVVLAQSGTPGAPSQSWTFYFTEVDGRIYSLAANAPLALAAPLAADSESVLASLRLHNATAAMSAQALR
ncbi:MAG: hypothetical protein H0W76_24655 [Pyrinomonadaceae bacterium]|nr:hypothetical protein [Pyrinomonadaceae bacterium]